MKVRKDITIDEEINKKLRKEGNASELINNLLEKYYTKGKNLSKIELENLLRIKQLEKATFIVKIETEITELKNTLKILEDKEEQLKDVPQELIQTFIRYPKLNASGIAEQFDKRFKKYNIPIIKLINIFNIIKSINNEEIKIV